MPSDAVPPPPPAVISGTLLRLHIWGRVTVKKCRHDTFAKHFYIDVCKKKTPHELFRDISEVFSKLRRIHCFFLL